MRSDSFDFDFSQVELQCQINSTISTIIRLKAGFHWSRIPQIPLWTCRWMHCPLKRWHDENEHQGFCLDRETNAASSPLTQVTWPNAGIGRKKRYCPGQHVSILVCEARTKVCEWFPFLVRSNDKMTYSIQYWQGSSSLQSLLVYCPIICCHLRREGNGQRISWMLETWQRFGRKPSRTQIQGSEWRHVPNRFWDASFELIFVWKEGEEWNACMWERSGTIMCVPSFCQSHAYKWQSLGHC